MPNCSHYLKNFLFSFQLCFHHNFHVYHSNFQYKTNEALDSLFSILHSHFSFLPWEWRHQYFVAIVVVVAVLAVVWMKSCLLIFLLWLHSDEQQLEFLFHFITLFKYLQNSTSAQQKGILAKRWKSVKKVLKSGCIELNEKFPLNDNKNHCQILINKNCFCCLSKSFFFLFWASKLNLFSSLYSRNFSFSLSLWCSWK